MVGSGSGIHSNSTSSYVTGILLFFCIVWYSKYPATSSSRNSGTTTASGSMSMENGGGRGGGGIEMAYTPLGTELSGKAMQFAAG